MRYGAGLEVGPHHIDWSELVGDGGETFGHSHIGILAARGHGKSAFFSYAYPLWRCWRDPNSWGFLISHSGDQVAEFMRIIKDGKKFVDTSGHEWVLPKAANIPIMRGIIPEGWERSWTTERIQFTNGSQFSAKTFGKSFRGGHRQWIVVDDPIKDNSQYSALERKKSKEFLFRTISPMLLPARGAQMVVIGTPMHGDDVHANLRELHEAAERQGRQPGDWLHRAYPGHWKDPATGESRYLWPRFRDAAWHRRERTQSELAYKQEIELKPVSDEASLFPPELFHRHVETMQPHAVMRPTKADIAARGWSVFIGVDLAISAEVKADNTVVVVLGVDDNQNRHLIDVIVLHGASYNRQVSAIIEASTRYGADLVFVEANQMQVVFADGVRDRSSVPVRAWHTGAEKHALRRGVPSLRPLLENGKLRFPRGDEYSITQGDILIEELHGFGIVDGRVECMGSHDDATMALWIADQAAREGLQFGFSGDGDEGEGEGEVERGREADAASVASLAAGAGAGAVPVLQDVVRADRAADRARAAERQAPRVNVGSVAWKRAALVAPGGLEEAQRVAATLPADRAAWAAAWNALQSPGLGGLAECDPAFAEAARPRPGGALDDDATPREVLRAILADLLDI